MNHTQALTFKLDLEIKGHIHKTATLTISLDLSVIVK